MDITPTRIDFLLTNGFGLAASTISSLFTPAWSTMTYLLPSLGVLWDATQVENEPNQSLEHIVPLKDRKIVLNKINTLRAAAGIDHKINIYFSTKQERYYASFGGRGSYGTPILEIPQFDLFRNDGFGMYGNEKKSKELKKDNWRFTDHETSFLILRELGRMKQNDALLKLITKIIMAIGVILFEFSSTNWIISLTVFGGSLFLFFLIDRIYAETLDRFAVNALTKHLKLEKLGGELEAIDISIRTLKKFQAQNLFHRDYSASGKFLVSPKGNRYFENSPSLTIRINRLEKRKASISKWIKQAPSPLSVFREGIRLFMAEFLPTTS